VVRQVTDVLVLCYHAVSDRWPADLSVTPSQLEAQVGFLLERGYRGVTFDEAVTAPPAPKTLAVTFDDGFRSTFEHGFAVLSTLGLPATIFVVTEFIDGTAPMAWPGIDHWLGGRHESELAPVSWTELQQLAAAGWEIGSHTRTHPRLTRCDDTTLERELRGSRERCEAQLGRPCRSLAYPFGDFDARIERAAADAGYATACTLPDRLRASTPLTWPRIGVWRSDTPVRFRIKVSSTFRKVRSSPAWPAVAAVRRLLDTRGAGNDGRRCEAP
jgi:peptidoglycan/xylan/chitin deacetylase (PgdA/CDA1 family)